MADPELPLPVEVPWNLAATTQLLVTGGPEETTLSLFTFEPDAADLTSAFPNERIIYLRFAVTLSPARIPGVPPTAALGEGAPCLFSRLDVTVRDASGETGTIRPYFHTAAPLHRSMVQTGIVGADAFEGESDQLSVGRSGSQMYESSSSHARTLSGSLGASVGIGPVSIGGSVRSTSTDVNASRSVTQQIDTTQRQASEERRELLSHMTKVENLLSLLDAKYIGTPYLRFSLSPRPLQLLSIDPTDPNLWFSQLLARRSSGLEGVQEFFAVVLVPKGVDFCIEARLKRVCVLDSPPGPLVFEPFVFNQHFFLPAIYANRVYPPGTPLDELDVDLVSSLPNASDFARPVVEGWVTSATGYLLADVASHRPGPGAQNLVRATVGYKHLLELWLELQRDEYEREVARSPVERGVLVGETRTLDTCFTFSESGLLVTNSTSSVTPLARIVVDPALVDLGGVRTDASDIRATVRDRAYETATRWNLLENRLATLLANMGDVPTRKLDFRDPDLLAIVLEAWRKLRPEDPRNLPLNDAARTLGLGRATVRVLRAAGVTNLRSLARVVLSAQDVERYAPRVVGAPPGTTLARGVGAESPEPTSTRPISTSEEQRIRQAIGSALSASASGGKS
jgi:hypothetical protein